MAETNSHWRDDLNQWMTNTASSLDDYIDIRWRYLKKRFGWDGVPKIQPYIGYANGQRVWLHGRVLTNPPAELPASEDTWWENLANTYQRFASDEVPDCDVEVRLGAAVHRVTTDGEGYFFVDAEHDFSDTSRGLWSAAAMQIVDHPKVAAEDTAVTCKIMTPPAHAKFGVISDVDDTILHTGVTRVVTMAKLTFLGNARTRLPLPGVAALYRAFQGLSADNGEHLNPIFYVSSSSWNLFDLLEDFLDLNGIPSGPLLLRDLGFDTNKFLMEGHDHKLDKTRRIMSAFPELPFLLIGDSGQEDATLYAQAAEEFGERVQAIFVRDVDPAEQTERDAVVRSAIARAKAVGVPMHLVADSNEVASIATSMGLIDETQTSAIQLATADDLSRSTV